MDHFSQEVIDKLCCYVYRLIDPRNGQTFYVGKGRGNRVFAHANDELKNYRGKSYIEEDESEESEKIKQIREIRNANLKVIYVIHRWGMDDQTALEVEAALIDSYPGLTNLQSGHGKEHGICNAQELEEKFGLHEYEEPKDFEYIIIKVTEKVLKQRNNNLYETVRSAWPLSLETANDINRYPYVFAVRSGIVRAVYKVEKWQNNSERGRIEFIGESVEQNDPAIWNRFVGKRLPKRYMKKGMASAALYSKNKESEIRKNGVSI